jgi:hypothetical protein
MRDTVICFRTSDDLRKALEKVSGMDRRSLSSVIENILYDYVDKISPKEVNEEKRRYPRKKISAPALVTDLEGVVHAGMVCDISLGGLHLSVPNTFQQETRDDARRSIVFTLPQSEKPLTMQCAPRYVRSNGQTDIGASLVDTDFHSYRTLQDYLAE